MGIRQTLPDGSGGGSVTPASSVVTETAFGQASAVGASLLYARGDHTHGTPATPSVPIVNAAATATLAANFSITGADGVFQDTGLSITLPSAGTYLLFSNVRVNLSFSGTGNAFIQGKLFNSTDAADVADSTRVILYVENAAKTYIVTAPITTVVTVVASKVIKLYAARTKDAAATYSSTQVKSDSVGYTTLAYLKVA